MLLCRLVCLSRCRLLFYKWDREFGGVKGNLGSEKSCFTIKKYHSDCLKKKEKEKEISVPIVKDVCLLCARVFEVLYEAKSPTQIPHPS